MLTMTRALADAHDQAKSSALKRLGMKRQRQRASRRRRDAEHQAKMQAAARIPSPPPWDRIDGAPPPSDGKVEAVTASMAELTVAGPSTHGAESVAEAILCSEMNDLAIATALAEDEWEEDWSDDEAMDMEGSEEDDEAMNEAAEDDTAALEAQAAEDVVDAADAEEAVALAEEMAASEAGLSRKAWGKQPKDDTKET